MAKIKDIYSNDDYYPFVLYCESRGFEDMADLMKLQFHNLRNEPDISPRLLSKIKTVYVMYSKAHAAEFVPGVKAAQKAVKRASSGSVPSVEVEKELEEYFQKNSDKLLHITDISKTIGKKAKRGDILKILKQASWCKAVDSTTFFYAR